MPPKNVATHDAKFQLQWKTYEKTFILVKNSLKDHQANSQAIVQLGGYVGFEDALQWYQDHEADIVKRLQLSNNAIIIFKSKLDALRKESAEMEAAKKIAGAAPSPQLLADIKRITALRTEVFEIFRNVCSAEIQQIVDSTNQSVTTICPSASARVVLLQRSIALETQDYALAWTAQAVFDNLFPLVDEKQAVQQKLEAAEQKNITLSGECESFKKTVETAAETLKLEQDRLNSSINKLTQDLSMERLTWTSSQQRAEDALRTKSEELTSANEEHDKVQYELDQLREAYEHILGSGEEGMKSLRETIDAHNTKLMDNDAAIRQHQQTEISLRQQVTDLEGELAQVKSVHKEELQKRDAADQDRIQSQAQGVQGLQEDIGKLKSALEDKETAMDTLRGDFVTLLANVMIENDVSGEVDWDEYGLGPLQQKISTQALQKHTMPPPNINIYRIHVWNRYTEIDEVFSIPGRTHPDKPFNACLLSVLNHFRIAHAPRSHRKDNLKWADELRWTRSEILVELLRKEPASLTSGQTKQIAFLPYLLMEQLKAAAGNGYFFSVVSTTIVDLLIEYDAFDFFGPHLTRNTENLSLLEAAGLLRMKMMFRRKKQNDQSSAVVSADMNDDEVSAAEYEEDGLRRQMQFDDARFKDDIVQQTDLCYLNMPMFLAAVCKGDILGEGTHKAWYIDHGTLDGTPNNSKTMIVADKELTIMFAQRNSPEDMSRYHWTATDAAIIDITWHGDHGTVSWRKPEYYQERFNVDFQLQDNIYKYIMACDGQRMAKAISNHWDAAELDENEEEAELDRMLDAARKDNRAITGTDI